MPPAPGVAVSCSVQAKHPGAQLKFCRVRASTARADLLGLLPAAACRTLAKTAQTRGPAVRGIFVSEKPGWLTLGCRDPADRGEPGRQYFLISCLLRWWASHEARGKLSSACGSLLLPCSPGVVHVCLRGSSSFVSFQRRWTGPSYSTQTPVSPFFDSDVQGESLLSVRLLHKWW